jgi:methylglutaconyl-CoA hydratase
MTASETESQRATGQALAGTSSLTVVGSIGTLTLHRAASRNALSLDMLRSMREKLDEAARMCVQPGSTRGHEDALRVLVVQGEGPAFCAGMDLKAVLGDSSAPLVLLSTLAEATIALRNLPCVTLAKVRGAAIGGGCGLAAVCDLCVTHEGSKMGYPEVDLGVCPAVVAPWLVQKVGMGRARRILLLGGVMSGAMAKELGMVDELVASEGELDAKCDAIATRLAQGGAHALAATKGLLNALEGSAGQASGVMLGGAMGRGTAQDAQSAHAQRLALAVREGAKLSADIVNSPATQGMLRARLK